MMSKKLENIELRSEEVQEILTRVPNWMIRWGSTLFLVLIFLILLLSWLVKYPDVIASEAIITTQIPPQKEFALISAKIDTIYVKDSQFVKENEVLAVLENTANVEDVYKLKSILDTMELMENQIDFPLDSLPLYFLGDIEQSFATFENSYFNYKLNQQLQPFSNDAVANRISLNESRSRLVSLEAQQRLSETEYKFKLNELTRNKTLYDKGVISQQEFESKQLEALLAERNLKNLSVSVSQIREAIGRAKKTSRGTEITRTREEKQLLKTTIQSFNQLNKSIRDWENTYVLKSDINGRVSFLNYWNKNQTVSKGDLVFTIIPTDNSTYLAKISAPSLNSGKIEVDQNVNVKLQNYPETEFGMLRGKIKSISLTPDKNGNYLIDVSLPKKLITSYNKEIEFKQEMRGTAEIITEDLRLLERFFYQFKQLFDR